MKGWQVKIVEWDHSYRMRVLNKKYWPHQHTVSNKADAERWCYENFKSANWRNVGETFAFKNETDCTFFMLKWG